jgi:pectate lyase
MAKGPEITTIASGYYSRTALNDNFTNIDTAFENTLSLDGSTPNSMGADLDLNNNDLLNASNLSVVGDFTYKGVILTDPSILVGVDFQEYSSISSLLASTELSRATGSIWKAGGSRYIEVASGGQFTTASGVQVKPIDGDSVPLLYSAQDRASNRTEAETMAKDISDMYGYAQANGCTGGGGGGTVRWVTNGKDDVDFPPVGSLRAAVEAAVTGDVIIFDPTGKIRIELVASIDTTGTDGIIIAAPAGNVEIAHAGDITAFRLYSNNLIIRGVKEVILPKSVEGGTERDFIDLDPLLCKLFWIDQITCAEGHDGSVDISTPTGGGIMTVPSYGTVSRSIFRGSDKTSLVRCSDAAYTDATMLYTTWYLNWFDHCAQRNPTIREQAKADIVNCVYGLQQKTQTGGGLSACYGADARTGGEISVRGCWFTTTVGSGFDAVKVGDANGAASVSNCFVDDGLLLETAGTVVTPTYTIPTTVLVDSEAGRKAAFDLVQGVSGAGRNAGAGDGYIFVSASTQEPNGDTIRAIRGTVTGRLIREESETPLPAVTLPQPFVARVGSKTIDGSGGITITGGYHTVTPATGTTDDLDTITFSGAVDGQTIRLMPSSSSATITVRSGVGNILLPAGTSIALDGAYAEAITLFWADHRSVWTVESK